MAPKSSPTDPDVRATFKVLLIGDSGTGKSSLLLRYTDDVWLQPDEVQATIGVDFKIKIADVDGRKYKLTIWDTAGQERFRTLTSSYYRGAHGVMFVYDVANRQSFENLQMWFEELETYSNTTEIVKIIVGNKCDRDIAGARQVTKREAEAFAHKMKALFVEASAKSRIGIHDTFDILVRQIAETPSLWQKSNTAPSESQIVQLDNKRGEDDYYSYCC
ncbi:P-loop containing nucleoside triphosphate hydrolase protein [Polychytrium aggregatum]|uniref:P-loop containing nucleoside triphosphate hydrolase protein n=1 Tax=Polychytrium aggregatum TaxID=110093 RepID=UPI0022FE5267|nr:P-loop containing nucleoside triphosphate hydrolase protein [Polychytrium aggregatum]KAI9204781.1 P-loop containing nucleoside triphosphate hydrolase protein [Polychytrium aggregatum]